jgi:hypothetical protein
MLNADLHFLLRSWNIGIHIARLIANQMIYREPRTSCMEMMLECIRLAEFFMNNTNSIRD